MLYFVRMTLSISFGVIAVFSLLYAIECHLDVESRRQRLELLQGSGSDAVVPSAADEYYESMLGTIRYRYGIGGVFLLFSATSLFAFNDGRNRSAADVARVYGPEDK